MHRNDDASIRPASMYAQSKKPTGIWLQHRLGHPTSQVRGDLDLLESLAPHITWIVLSLRSEALSRLDSMRLGWWLAAESAGASMPSRLFAARANPAGGSKPPICVTCDGIRQEPQLLARCNVCWFRRLSTLIAGHRRNATLFPAGGLADSLAVIPPGSVSESRLSVVYAAARTPARGS